VNRSGACGECQPARWRQANVGSLVRAWRQRRAIQREPGAAPQEIRIPTDNQALKARFNLARLLNPKRTAHRNQRRACEATRGIPPERCECDAAQVVPRHIAPRYRADSDSPKRRHIPAAKRNRDTERQAF
jgi:hypothetical protein